MGIYRFGLRDLKIAAWIAENSYGTALDIDAARQFTVTLVTATATLEGDDVEKDSYAKIKSIEATMEHGEVSLGVLDLLTGGTPYAGAGYDDMKIGQDDNVPYFSICGQVVGTSTGDTHLWIPKGKIMGNLSYQAQQNNYLIPSVQIKGVSEGTINGMLRIRHHDAVTAVAIPIA